MESAQVEPLNMESTELKSAENFEENSTINYTNALRELLRERNEALDDSEKIMELENKIVAMINETLEQTEDENSELKQHMNEIYKLIIEREESQDDLQKVIELQDRINELLKEVELLIDENKPQQEESAKLSEYNKSKSELYASSDEEDNKESSSDEMNAAFNSEWAHLHEIENNQDNNNEIYNEINVYDTAVPLDLSNDIAVNDIAAGNPEFPLNPDAELIDVINPLSSMSMQSKFEKISMVHPSSYHDQESESLVTHHDMK